MEKAASTAPPTSYRQSLGPPERTRYMKKLQLIDGNDPYELDSWGKDVELLPSVTYPDIVNYMVVSPSPYTLEDLKSYKGMESYNQFVCGWVRDIASTVINNKHVVMAKILRRYDIALVQEIRDISGQAPIDLLDEINSAGPYLYDMIISDRLGRTNHKEQYAFYYRNETGISVVDSYHYNDVNDTFNREPWVVHFHINFTVVTDVVFIPIHAWYQDAVNETSALVDVYDDAVTRWHEENALILGDFNADCSYITQSEWPDVALRTDQRFEWEIKDYVDTTVSSGTDCAYDRIVVAGDDLQPNVVGCTAKEFRFDDEYSLNSTMAASVSDHYPVEIELEEA